MTTAPHQVRPSSRFSKATILVVNDDPSDFQHLKEAGHDIHFQARFEQIGDVKQVLPRLTGRDHYTPSELPHLILLGSHLSSGRGDGASLIERLKAVPRLREIPVVVYGGPSAAPVVPHAGAAAVISKPDSYAGYFDLLQTLRGVLERRTPVATAAAGALGHQGPGEGLP